MSFVTTLHLQASADAALSCKPVQPVTTGGRGYTLIAKYAKECEKQKVYSGVFRFTFFTFHTSFFAFRISQHFAPESTFARKVEGFCGLFFSKCKIQKVYTYSWPLKRAHHVF